MEDRNKWIQFRENLLKKAISEGKKAEFDTHDLCLAITEALVVFALQNKHELSTDEMVLEELPRAVAKVCYNFAKVAQRKNRHKLLIA